MNQSELFAWVRAVGALFAILTLLALMIFSYVEHQQPVAQQTGYLLVGLVLTLLGIDQFFKLTNGS